MTVTKRINEPAGVDLLVKSVELSLVEYMTITRCQADIEQYLGKYISRFSTVLPGAFARKTMTSPLAGSEVDLLVLFSPEAMDRFTPSELLYKLFVTLEDRFTGTQQIDLKRCVRVPVEDFCFLVRPGFVTGENRYMVPSQLTDNWVRYDAFEYKMHFLTEDNRQNGMLKHVVQLVKTWNHATGKVFDDYYLELLVWEALQGYAIASYSETLRYVFRKALGEVVFKKDDPASPDLQVDGLVDIEDLVGAMHHFHDSFRLASEAFEYEQAGDMQAATAKWRELFPGCFPSDKETKIKKAMHSGLRGADALRSLVK